MVVVSWSDDQTFARDAKTEQYAALFELKNVEQRKVSYHFNDLASHYHFGAMHPMKPFRLMLTDHLVLGYKMHEKLDWYRPRRATEEEVLEFHASEYVDFLKNVTPHNADKYKDMFEKFNIGGDCPIFDGMYDYARLTAGASIDASRKLISGVSDIAINWSGGLHHAKKFEPSGFCYVNDIVLAILNLLRVHPRVLYIDIDVHHGDGVQEAFYATDRVMTLSFHKYDGEYFPATGNFDEVGVGMGVHHALNVPIRDGIDDESYIRLFRAIVEPVLLSYQPSVVVLQCGADSLGGDRLGVFNLNIRAHGRCVNFVRELGFPLIVLGGGGYTPRNVSRLWCYETSVCLGVDLDPKLPSNIPFMKYFEPDYSLHPTLSGRVENKNSRKYLEMVRARILEELRYLNHAPSVQMQIMPPDIAGFLEEEEKRLQEEKQAAHEREYRASQEQKDAARAGEMTD
ncbi:hypothetical protein CANCADRAFT_1312 [Tortispora caseinolytica NRRL Y-17796]|uniref:Histone deacetylase n=1 Tax=Tortispora caseinolytica NRRL Y-17796 TaxID=767744 RepID=A0A1E4TLW4_9ASCO|nr:hypothetical protein CANCADRAFT_1312 [Tortispora caseinolytica NRRL Y-17796]